MGLSGLSLKTVWINKSALKSGDRFHIDLFCYWVQSSLCLQVCASYYRVYADFTGFCIGTKPETVCNLLAYTTLPDLNMGLTFQHVDCVLRFLKASSALSCDVFLNKIIL